MFSLIYWIQDVVEKKGDNDWHQWDRMKQIKKNSAPSADQKETISQEQERRLRNILGDKLYEWLSALSKQREENEKL